MPPFLGCFAFGCSLAKEDTLHSLAHFVACDFTVNALDGSFFDRPALHKFPRFRKIRLKGTIALLFPAEKPAASVIELTLPLFRETNSLAGPCSTLIGLPSDTVQPMRQSYGLSKSVKNRVCRFGLRVSDVRR